MNTLLYHFCLSEAHRPKGQCQCLHDQITIQTTNVLTVGIYFGHCPEAKLIHSVESTDLMRSLNVLGQKLVNI